MKKGIYMIFAALMASAGLSSGVVDLNGNWELKAFPQPDDGAIRSLPLPDSLEVKSYCATVPGCCELELMKAGELPDHMVSTNAFAWREYEGHQWLCSKTFAAPKREPGERCVIVFDGIDTLADVFLNGKKVGETDNMLIPHEFDVTGKVREGEENEVAVLIRPVGLAAREVSVGELGHTMQGGADHEQFRKAPHMYGWDIMPRLPVSGIWRDVRFEVRPAVRIENPAWIVRRLDRQRNSADIIMQCRIVSPFRNYYKAKVRCTLSRDGRVCAKDERLFRGPQFKAQLWLGNAQLWWPRGAGAQPLYDAKIEIVGENGMTLAENPCRIGIRTVALEYDDRKLPERPGRMLFRVNGEPIYVRGVDWVPLDPIPSEQARHLKDVLPMMADLNANLVRVWGGGVYEPDEFFDWCDENGVMVWQDFMTACAVPPQDDEFAERFRKEVLSVVFRLRNRASLVLWAGDNENDLASGWSLGELARDPNTYRITREVIPNVLKEYDVTRPYLPSSPYVTKEAFAKKVDPAEDHMWGGPRGWWKTDYYTKTPCWFCSEGGAHAVPARSSLERMMGKAAAERPWKNPDVAKWQDLEWTDEWRYRSTCPMLDPKYDPWKRNGIVLRQCAAIWGDVPRHDLDLLIAQSQTAQAESIKFQTENFRSQKFVSKGGFVVWNLRDGWPTVSDAFTDYYGEKKKAYAAVKTSYQDVLVMVTEDGRLLAINDTLRSVKGHVKVIEAKDGKPVFDGPFEVAANGLVALTKLAWDGQGLYRIEWTSSAGPGKNHYLHGLPPFKWDDYCVWRK